MRSISGLMGCAGPARDVGHQSGAWLPICQGWRRSIDDWIRVDGRDRSVYQSLGGFIAESPEAIRQFWRWFHDSAIVDDDDRPLVCFHGTPAPIFDRFRSNGVFVTTDAESARQYGNRIIPVFIAASSVLTVSTGSDLAHAARAAQRQEVEAYGRPTAFTDAVVRSIDGLADLPPAHLLWHLGHRCMDRHLMAAIAAEWGAVICVDDACVRDARGGVQRTIFATPSATIKAAIGNAGTFLRTGNLYD